MRLTIGHATLRTPASLRLRGFIGEGRPDFEKIRTARIGRTLGGIGLLALKEFVGGIAFDRNGPLQM